MTNDLKKFWERRGIELVADDVEIDDCTDLQFYYNGKLFIITDGDGRWDLYYPTTQGNSGILPLDGDIIRWAREAGYERPAVHWISKPWSKYWIMPGTKREMDIDLLDPDTHDEFPPAEPLSRFEQ